VRIVLLGPPGAGKGTQAYRLATRYHIPLISTGDIFRRNVEEGSDLGKKAKSYMDDGELIPDDIVVEMVVRALDATGGGFILDGFPRTIPQADNLEDRTVEKNMRLTAAIAFVIDDETAVRRVAGRRTCTVCQRPYNVAISRPREVGICDRCGGKLVQREDDQEATVRHRLEVYHRLTQPLMAFYGERGLLREIQAEGSLDQVTERAIEALETTGEGEFSRPA
jgi:adenylate kinase